MNEMRNNPYRMRQQERPGCTRTENFAKTPQCMNDTSRMQPPAQRSLAAPYAGKSCDMRDRNKANTQRDMWDRRKCMQNIYELGFIMIETALFLDTHPEDAEALAYYAEMKEKYHEAVRFYSDNFGPLNIHNVTNENYWSWVATPMPWEVEG